MNPVRGPSADVSLVPENVNDWGLKILEGFCNLCQPGAARASLWVRVADLERLGVREPEALYTEQWSLNYQDLN